MMNITAIALTISVPWLICAFHLHYSFEVAFLVCRANILLVFFRFSVVLIDGMASYELNKAGIFKEDTSCVSN